MKDERFKYLKNHNELVLFKAAELDPIYLDLLYRIKLYPDSSWKKWIDGEGGQIVYCDGKIKSKFVKDKFIFTSDLLYNQSLEIIKQKSKWFIKDKKNLILLGNDERIRVWQNNKRINCFQIKLQLLLNYIQTLNIKLIDPFISDSIV